MKISYRKVKDISLPKDIDSGIGSVVRTLNSKDEIMTLNSCEGLHGGMSASKPYQPSGYVDFVASEKVADEIYSETNKFSLGLDEKYSEMDVFSEIISCLYSDNPFGFGRGGLKKINVEEPRKILAEKIDLNEENVVYDFVRIDSTLLDVDGDPEDKLGRKTFLSNIYKGRPGRIGTKTHPEKAINYDHEEEYGVMEDEIQEMGINGAAILWWPAYGKDIDGKLLGNQKRSLLKDLENWARDIV